MGYKSRNLYSNHIVGADNFDNIFGKRERIVEDTNIVKAKILKDSIGFTEQPNMKEIIKIGKEINRFKDCDKPTAKDVDARFKSDADKLFIKKPDEHLTKQMATFFCRELQKERRR